MNGCHRAVRGIKITLGHRYVPYMVMNTHTHTHTHRQFS